MNTRERIKAIQARLGLKPDGIIGPATLTAIERLLTNEVALTSEANRVTEALRMTCSATGLSSLKAFEISSEAYYKKRLRTPTWPGGASGVTIGIGYDLGYVSVEQMHRDWDGKIADADIKKLESVCRLKGEDAKAKVTLASIRSVSVSLESASEVFHLSSLPYYAAICMRAYPGVDKLPADAQAGLLSLVLNRGARKSGASRREMKALEPLVANADLDGISNQILSMKRLWEGKGLDGLLRRREHEAAMVKESERDYDAGELIQI